MKVLISMTILIAIATLLLSVPIPPSDQLAANEQNAITQQEKHSESNPGVAVNSNIKQPNTAKQTKDAEDNSEKFLTNIYLISAPFVVFVGIGTAILVRRQIVALKRIERAWMVVKEWSGPTSLFTREQATASGATGAYVSFVYKFENRGKTPARITGGKMRFCVLKSPMPKKPDYGDMSKGSRPVSVPLDGRFVCSHDAPFAMQVFYRGDNSFMLTEDEIAKIRSGEIVYCCYAILRYQDAFKHNRETRVCYVWHSPNNLDPFEGFRLDGPDDYNRHT